jgi:hypothetical protein
MLPSSKKPGCCTLCGEEVFEVVARWPSDHPLHGEPRAVGKPFPSARRATLVLMSGTTCSITLCDTCQVTPENLPSVWRICLIANSQQIDEERRSVVCLYEHTDEEREACLNSLQKMVVDLPMAVLVIQKWEEVDEFSDRTG